MSMETVMTASGRKTITMAAASSKMLMATIIMASGRTAITMAVAS